MTDDKVQPNVNDRPDQTKPARVDQQSQHTQASASAQPGQPPTPRRRPLLHLKGHAHEARPVHRP